MSSAIFAIEKADAKEGIIQLCVGKARTPGELGDRDGQGLDWIAFAKAVQSWVTNYGQHVTITMPDGRSERRYVGLFDTHGQALKADLLGAWCFPEERKARIIVRPHDRKYAEMAASGRITGASWAGFAHAKKVAA